jgi:hypothetical protein
VIDHIMWIVSAAALAGAWMVNRKMWQGQAVWCATNVAWVAYDLWIGAWAQAGLFAAFLVLSVVGCVKWLREERAKGGAR